MRARNDHEYALVVGDWDVCREDAFLVRREVFVVEQNVPLEEEQDDMDAVSLHIVAYSSEGKPLGTGRLLPDGHIGRLAVRRCVRGRGLGSTLLTRLVDEAVQRGHREVVLAAQLHAQSFYAAHGFVAEGAVFLDAGIEHILMRRAL